MPSGGKSWSRTFLIVFLCCYTAPIWFGWSGWWFWLYSAGTHVAFLTKPHNQILMTSLCPKTTGQLLSLSLSLVALKTIVSGICIYLYLVFLFSFHRQFEMVIPTEDSVITEMTSTLRDWGTMWKQLYVVGNFWWCVSGVDSCFMQYLNISKCWILFQFLIQVIRTPWALLDNIS